MAGSHRRLRVGKRNLHYEALESQSGFHNQKSRIKGFSGPVGSGKTEALSHEALRLAFKNAGCTGLVGAPTYRMLRDTTLQAFLAALEENRVDYKLNRSALKLTVLKRDASVIFRSMEEPERLRGTNLAWFAIDELTYCSEESWLRLEARLREPKALELCGAAVWTPKGFDWVYRRFIAEPVKGYWSIQAKPFENRFILDGAPDFYERLKASYSESFYKQEVLGQYVNQQAGQVYHAFRREANVGEYDRDPAEPLIWSWDFNVNPMASVICQRCGDTMRVVDEIFLRTSSTEEVCEEFVRRYKDWKPGVRIYGDASGGQKRSVSPYSDYELIRRFFAGRRGSRTEIVPARSNPPVRDRINLTNAMLQSADGNTRLQIDRRCRELLKDLEQICYKPDSGIIDKQKDSDRSHLADALGYLLWQEFQSWRKIGARNRRLV